MNVEKIVGLVKKDLAEDSKLNTLYYIHLEFEVNSCIRIGVGGARREAFLPVLKVIHRDKYYPVVPESSWRGALRKIGETIAKSSITEPKNIREEILISHIEPEEGPITHIDPSEDEINKLKELGERELVERFAPTYEEAEEALKNMITYLCPICRLWGGPGVRSRIVLEDTVIHEYESYSRTHVGISRITRTKEEHQLYTPEYIYVKQLNLNLTIYNIKPETIEAKILAGTLSWLTKLGLSIGGSKSRGIGYLKLNTDKSYAYIACLLYTSPSPRDRG